MNKFKEALDNMLFTYANLTRGIENEEVGRSTLERRYANAAREFAEIASKKNLYNMQEEEIEKLMIKVMELTEQVSPKDLKQETPKDAKVQTAVVPSKEEAIK